MTKPTRATNARIFSSRRAYEYNADDIRLTLLTTAPVREAIKEAFGFKDEGITLAPPTFGDVPTTQPPAISFNLGTFLTDSSEVVPIRFINVEQSRIVIDVASTSEYLDPIFDQLIGSIEKVPTPKSLRAVGGTPIRRRDYSEATAAYSFEIAEVLIREFREALVPAWDKAAYDVAGPELVIVPSLYLQIHAPDQPFSGSLQPGYNTVQFALRVGTKPSDHVYFSSVFLDSTAHLELIDAINKRLVATPARHRTASG